MKNRKCPTTAVFPFALLTQRRTRMCDFIFFPRNKSKKIVEVPKFAETREYFSFSQTTHESARCISARRITRFAKMEKERRPPWKKDAVRSIFQWSSKKRSRTTLGSKGKRKGESSEKTKEETLEKNLSAMWKEAWCHRETTNWSSGKKQHSWKNLEIQCRITKMKTKSASMLAPCRRINWTCPSVFLLRIFVSKTNIFGFTLVSYPGMNFYICF